MGKTRNIQVRTRHVQRAQSQAVSDWKIMLAAVTMFVIVILAVVLVVTQLTRTPKPADKQGAPNGPISAQEPPAAPIILPDTVATEPEVAASPPKWQFADEFDVVEEAGWQNRPIVRDLVDDDGRSTHPMPAASDGIVKGIGGGYNNVCPWMVKPAKLQGRRLSILFAGKSGDGLMNQAGIWLLADSWDADMKPATGYEVLLYGESAERLSIYRYENRKSVEIARFVVGPDIHSEHEYALQRDDAGNWSATMGGKPLRHGTKDRGTPDITFQDATYPAFAFVGIHFNSAESQLDYVRIKAE